MTRRFYISIVAAASMMLAACTPTLNSTGAAAPPITASPTSPPVFVAPVVAPVVRTAQGVVLRGAQALYFAELTYKGAGTLLIAGLEADRFDDATKAKINRINRMVIEAFERGKAAIVTGDVAVQTLEAGKAFELISQLSALVQGPS